MVKTLTPQELRLIAQLDKYSIQARRAEARCRDLALALRDTDVPWETIGRTVGISRQGAQQRFSA